MTYIEILILLHTSGVIISYCKNKFFYNCHKTITFIYIFIMLLSEKINGGNISLGLDLVL